MVNFKKRLSTGILCVSTLVFGTTTHAELSDIQRQNEEIVARGGVVVIVSALSMVSGVFGAGFQQVANARSKDTKTDFGKVSQLNSTVRQNVLIGADPGDVVRLEFIPKTQRALLYASEDMKVVADVWAERVKNLEARQASLLADIENVKDDHARLAPDSRPPKLSANGKIKRIAEISRDLEDTKSILKTAHMKAGEARAQYMTTHANYEFSTRAGNGNFDQLIRTGKMKSPPVIMEIPVQHSMPLTPDYALTRILAPDDVATARGVTPSVRILRFDARNTNVAMRSARIARAGFAGLAIGVVIALEEITVGAISSKMAEKSAQHFAPELRIEPNGTVQ